MGFAPTCGLLTGPPFSPSDGDGIGPGGWTPIALAYGNHNYAGVLGNGQIFRPYTDEFLPFADPRFVPEGEYFGIAFGFGKFVAVGANGGVIVSTNGDEWSAVPPSTAGTLRGVGATDVRFIAVGDCGSVLLSPAALP